MGQDGVFLRFIDELMNFVGEDVDVVQGEHVKHKKKALFDGFFVEMLDLGLFPVFVQVADFFNRKLPMICIFQ